MKYKLINSKIFGGRFISISVAIASICAVALVQNCAFGSKIKGRQVDALKLPYTGSQWGPKMVYVEGGLVVTGGRFGSPFNSGGSESKVVTISAFYMSETPVTNRNYAIYLSDLWENARYADFEAALPNSTVWKKEFVFNDSLEKYRSARVFLDYPVVGLTYHQCVNYTIWLTEKEKAISLGTATRASKALTHMEKKVELKAEPVIDTPAASAAPNDASQVVTQSASGASNNPATTVNNEATSVAAPVAAVTNTEITRPVVISDVERLKTLSKGLKLTKEEEAELLERDVPLTDEEFAKIEKRSKLEKTYTEHIELAGGEQLLRYRLPTEAEFDFATKATQATQDEHGVETTMVGEYGQPGSTVRFSEGKHKGEFVGLFKRGYGDYKGVPGSHPTDAPTEEAGYRPVNAVGVNTIGNVWKWTCEEYRQTPAIEFSDLNPVRVDGFLDDSYDKSSPMSRKCRVIKGGSYAVTPEELRSYMNEDEAANDVGFMVAASVA